MVKACMLVLLPLPSIAWIIIALSNSVMGSPQFPAMFVFGDSLVDNGNNNYLTSLAKANYYPYGIDFYGGTTGRFCNGKTIIDFLGDLVGLPPLPPFAATASSTGRQNLNGVNFASAAAGILDETGQNLGDRFTLRQQVKNFESVLRQLKKEMDAKEMSNYLAKSLVVMNIGSNDYLNNYLLPSIYPSSFTYNPRDFAALLIKNFQTHLSALHGLGLRKFLIAAIGPLGCIPNQLAMGLAPPGSCVSFVNGIVEVYNMQLKSLVDRLNTYYNNSSFVFGNTYGVFTEIISNPTSYGFAVTDRGCCGIGRNQGQITCLPLIIPCLNRDQYVFWDAYHPTQAFNKIVAQRAYSGPPSDCYPFNIEQLAAA